MPWYWSDDIARLLSDKGLLSADAEAILTGAPFAYRSEEPPSDDGVAELAEDEEIPLAA